MPEISCAQFTDLLIRKSEHLDDEILRDITPAATLIGQVETGRFAAQDGNQHTFDKFNRVFPDMSTPWSDVTSGACIGTPCDPTETKIGMGFTRDSYKLQSKSYATDLFCYDLIMSADRAKQQFANTLENLRDATVLINDNRLRNEMFRTAGQKWVATMTGLMPITFTETGDLIGVTPSALPTSKMVVNMLRQRIDYQLLSGALGKNVKGMDPQIEVLASANTIYDLVQGDSNLSEKWRFDRFSSGAKEYYKYGWFAQVGPFMLKADLHPIRFQIGANGVLQRVFPYVNTAATQGIKGVVNDAFINAPVEALFIWHRRAMRSLVRDNTSVNSQMPFAARDFGGKWQFAMDNLTCGTAEDANGLIIPIAVDNARRNKGKFIADFSYATQSQYPEYAEMFLVLREQPCVVGNPGCNVSTAYPTQNYNSANELCLDE